MDFYIRTSHISDALQIATIQIKTWRSTYRGIIDDTYLDAMNIENRKNSWEKILKDLNRKVFVVYREKEVIGFITCENQGNIDGYDSEISSLYILPEQQGKGLGRKLFETGKKISFITLKEKNVHLGAIK